MKLNESSNYTVNLYNPMDISPAMTIKSNRICLNSPFDSTGKNIPFELSSAIVMQIDLSTFLSTGKPIIIEEDGIEKFDNVSYNELYYEVYSYMRENNKEFAIFVYNSSGESQNVYVGKNVSYYIPLELPKTTEITIDGKKLYLHRTTFEIMPVSLLRQYVKEE